MTQAGELFFPYMEWAHLHAARTSAPLSQSGLPTADARLLASFRGLDLGHPTAEALPALERAIAAHLDVDPRRVLLTLGATGGMHLCAWRWFRPGARVVTDRPSYEPFRALPEALGAQTLIAERRLEQGWRLDPAQVARLLEPGSGPAHVFTANPHNPTGACAGADELRELAGLCARSGGVLIVCEVYMEYAPRSERVHAFRLAPNAISIGSLTKAYGLGALRAGWIVLGEGLAHEARRLRDLAYLSYVDPPTVAMQAARAAFERMDELWQPVAQSARECRPLFDRWLSTTGTVESTVPAHGIIAFPRVRSAPDTLALCEQLVREHQVDVVPGEFFGLAGYVRVGCGVAPALLEQGLARLTRGLEAWRAAHGG